MRKKNKNKKKTYDIFVARARLLLLNGRRLYESVTIPAATMGGRRKCMQKERTKTKVKSLRVLTSSKRDKSGNYKKVTIYTHEYYNTHTHTRPHSSCQTLINTTAFSFALCCACRCYLTKDQEHFNKNTHIVCLVLVFFLILIWFIIYITVTLLTLFFFLKLF